MWMRRSTLPPRGLIALLIGITVAPLAAFLWLGCCGQSRFAAAGGEGGLFSDEVRRQLGVER
jgi:hypothetical protein